MLLSTSCDSLRGRRYTGVSGALAARYGWNRRAWRKGAVPGDPVSGRTGAFTRRPPL